MIREKLIDPILNLLKQGVTPEKLSWSFAVGILLGTFPILGITTALCVLATFLFKLNPVAIQVANYLAYPLQFILLIPFMRLGETIFGVDHVALQIPELLEFFKRDWTGFLKTYGMTGLRGVFAWALLAPWVTMILRHSFLILFRRISARRPGSPGV